MAHYRLYCLDSLGKIVSGHDIHAPDDDAAREVAREYCHEYKIDLWQGVRWVGELEKAA